MRLRYPDVLIPIERTITNRDIILIGNMIQSIDEKFYRVFKKCIIEIDETNESTFIRDLAFANLMLNNNEEIFEAFKLSQEERDKFDFFTFVLDFRERTNVSFVKIESLSCLTQVLFSIGDDDLTIARLIFTALFPINNNGEWVRGVQEIDGMFVRTF